MSKNKLLLISLFLNLILLIGFTPQIYENVKTIIASIAFTGSMRPAAIEAGIEISSYFFWTVISIYLISRIKIKKIKGGQDGRENK